MLRKKPIAQVMAVVLLAAVLSACGSKDLVSLARLDRSELFVRDKFGNQVKVPNPDDFLKVLKGAKKIADPKDDGTAVKTGYVFFTAQSTVYYDDDGKYLVYTGPNQKRQVYQADLSDLVSKLPGLPPKIAVGKDLDAKLSSGFETMSRVTEPWALSFESEAKQVVMVAAGQKPSAGYTMELEKASLNQDGTLALTVRVSPPAGAAATVMTYPYLEIVVQGSAELDVRMVSASSGGDKTEHVGLTGVKGGQSVIPMRPERGSLVTERVRVTGFVKASSEPTGVEIAVEDGHDVLGAKTVSAPAASSGWSFFEADMDLKMATNPYGAVVLRATIDGASHEVTVPVSFSGK